HSLQFMVSLTLPHSDTFARKVVDFPQTQHSPLVCKSESALTSSISRFSLPSTLSAVPGFQLPTNPIRIWAPFPSPEKVGLRPRRTPATGQLPERPSRA